MAQSTPALPEGQPTIVLFDIVGSTKQLLALGSTVYTSQQQQPFFDLCDRLRIENQGEQYGSHQGDALLYIFELAPQAVTFADSLLGSLRDHPIEAYDALNGTQHRVQIRLAVHKAQETMRVNEHGDYGYHPDVVYTARLLAIALDDQILLSETLYSAIDAKQFACHEYINRRIRNWDTPQTVYERLWDSKSKGEPGSRFLPSWFREMNRYIPRPDMENAIIHAYLERTPSGGVYRLITLRGYGGMGKTRLALQCAANLGGIFGDAMHVIELGDLFADTDTDQKPGWLGGTWLKSLFKIIPKNSQKSRNSSGATLRALLAERIGRQYGLQGEQALPANLPQAMPKGMRLLIIDNYESVNCDEAANLLVDLLAANDGLHILVTGREALEMDDIEKQFPIARMIEREASQLFIERTAQKRDHTATPMTPADEMAITRILHYTECIPLALELAAARSGQKSLTEIADGLEKAPLGAETETAPRHRRADRAERHKSLTKSLNWSFSLLSLAAQEALPYLGLFSDSFTAETAALACGVPNAQAVLDELLEASLVSRIEDESQHSRYTVLRPTHAYAIEKFNALSNAEAGRQRFVMYYLRFVEGNGGMENLENAEKRGRLDLEWRNALTAAEYAKLYDNAVTYFADALYVYLDHSGRWADAIPLCQYALSVREATLGSEHPDTASSLSNLGSLYLRQARYSEAEQLFVRALASGLKNRGPENTLTATRLNNLAVVCVKQGRYEDARLLYVESLTTLEKNLGPEHPEIAIHLNNLAEVYVQQGLYAKAEPMLLRALAIREKTFGPEHANTAGSLNNLASFYNDQGLYAKAEPMLLRALAIREKTLGPEHANTATSLHNLAFLYSNQERDAEAEPLLQRAIAIREKVLGPEHPELAFSLQSLAILYLDSQQGRQWDALRLSERALNICEKTLGQQHPTTIGLREFYVNFLRAMADELEAQDLQDHGNAPHDPESV